MEPLARSPVRTLPLALLLLGGMLVQQAAGWNWSSLARLQEGEGYMQLSGYLLLALVLHQWYLSALRIRGDVRRAADQLGLHALAGALGPAFFFLHSQRLGYGYLAGLSLVFIAAMATGLVNLDAPADQPRWLRQVRVSVHVALATALVVGIGYHVYVSYEFE